MAIENAKTLNVRIKNKYDSYENWAASGLILEAGEIAIAYTTVNVEVGNGKIEQHPELLMKVGDGEKTFANLPWLSAKAADVAAWAKAANKPTYEAKEITGIGSYIAEYVDKELGISVDTDTQYQIVKVDDYNYKLQCKGKGEDAWADVADSVIVIPNDTAAIEALQGLVGTESVATQIANAIAPYSTTEQMNTAIATAKGEAEKHADDLNDAMNTRVEALEAVDHEHANAAELAKIADGDVAKWNAAEQNAKDYADGLNTTMDGRVATLEGKFTGEGSVASQIEAAVAAEAKLREDADKALDAKIGVASSEGVEATGLHADIEANAAAIEALEGLVGTTGVADQIATAVAAEAEIARAAEGANAQAITDLTNGAVKSNTDAIAKLNADVNTEGSVDYKVAQEVAKILNDNDASDIDTLEEIAAWIKNDTAGVADLNRRVTDNANAITKLNGDASTEGSVAKSIADAIDAENLGQYATDTELEALDGRVEVVEGLVGKASVEGGDAATGLFARVETAEADITALEGLVGEKAVATQISEAIDGALMVTGEGDTKVEKYALATALAETNTEVAKKADDASLAAVAKSGLIDDLSIGEGTVLVFDCGTSAV